MSFFPGKCHQIWWIFWKYQSVPYPNLTKIGCLQPQKEEAESLPTINFSECLLSVLGSTLDFRGRIAWLKIRFSKIRALNRLWKIACLMCWCVCVHIYTHLHFWRSTLRLEIHPSSTELNHCVKKSHIPFMWLPSFNKVFFTQRTPQVLFTPKPPRSLNKALIFNGEIVAWERYPEITASQQSTYPPLHTPWEIRP